MSPTRTLVVVLGAVALLTACATDPWRSGFVAAEPSDPLLLEMERWRTEADSWNREHAEWARQWTQFQANPAWRALMEPGLSAAELSLLTDEQFREHGRQLRESERLLAVAQPFVESEKRLEAWRQRLEDRRLQLLQMFEARRAARERSWRLPVCLSSPLRGGGVITSCF